MDMRTGAIWSGTRTAAQGIRSAAGAGTAASFAAQMAEMADSLALNDPAGDPTLKAAFDQLSDASKGVLERMKAGQGGVSKEGWTELCRELKDAGMISESDFAYTRADLRAVPIADLREDGCTVLHGDGDGLPLASLKDPEWSGDPLEALDQWMEELREVRARIAGLCQRHFKMSIFAEKECHFLLGGIQVLSSLIHHITCRLEVRQALIYQLASGLTGENGKYNYSKAVHLYPPLSCIPCSAKNYKIALALTGCASRTAPGPSST